MPDERNCRLPAKPVWITHTTKRRKDPGTGRPRRIRVAIVRWREDGDVHQKAFTDPIAAGRYAAEKQDELEGLRRAPLSATTTFSDWTERSSE